MDTQRAFLSIGFGLIALAKLGKRLLASMAPAEQQTQAVSAQRPDKPNHFLPKAEVPPAPP